MRRLFAILLRRLRTLIPQRRRFRMGIETTNLSDEEFEAAYMRRMIEADPQLMEALFDEAAEVANAPKTIQ